MGVTVRQKKKGRGKPWWVFIHHNGKRSSKNIGDRAAAEKVASEIRKALKAGELNLPSTRQAEDVAPLFGDYAMRYLEDYAKVALKWSTWSGYEQMLHDHILPALEDKRIDEITRADIKKLLLAKTNAGYAPSTVQNIQVLVSGIFTHAYEEEIIKAHPAQKMGRYIGKQDRRANVNPITGDQVKQVLATCRTEFPEWYALILTAFRTGMRLGELMGLGWDDVDFDARRIEVRRGYSHSRWSTPKSHKSRLIDMSDQLAQTLQDHQAAICSRFGRLPTTKVRLSRSKSYDIQMVFPNSLGRPNDGDTFRKKVFVRLIGRSGLPPMRIHDMRHTFASLLLQNGESLHYVKEQMGHASIQTTVDVYGHLVPGSNRNAVNRLDDPTPDLPPLKIAGQAG